MRSLQLAGMPIIHIDLGYQLGTVHSVLLDPEARRVTALLVMLPQGWRKKGLLRIEDVYAIGDRAVTVQHGANLILPDQDESLWSRWRERVDLHGVPILTEDGHGLGSVAAFDFELDGRITRLGVRQGVWQRLTQPPWVIPGTYLRAFGAHAVIVEARAMEEFLKAKEDEGREGRQAITPPETQTVVATTPAPSSAAEGEGEAAAGPPGGLLARLQRWLPTRNPPDASGASRTASADARPEAPDPAESTAPPRSEPPEQP